MTVNDLTGYYTYRSFLDRPQPVNDFNTIKFAEAELFLYADDDGTVTGTLSFPPEPSAPQKEFMDLQQGWITSYSPLRLHFLAVGRPGSAITDFEYEYDCTATTEWDADPAPAPPQRIVLTGTVRRNKDHGDARAGATASFVAVRRDFAQPRSVPGVALIPEAIAMLASRVHRLRHTVWHTVRADWFRRQNNQLVLADDDRAFISSLGWGLADPPFNRDGVFDLANGAGEDFLFMHRRMIAMVNELYRRKGLEPPRGWTRIPGPVPEHFVYKGESNTATGLTEFKYEPLASGFMVPPADTEMVTAFGDGIGFIKSRRFFTNVMRNLENTLRNPRVLAQLTLGAYGNMLEFTIHNWMHVRWTSPPPRGEDGSFIQRNDSYDIDTKWDVASNDSLFDFHSSHVNPLFWKLHGWVDDRIEDWISAHEASSPGSVKRRTLKGIDWFEQGLWVVKADPFDWPEPAGSDAGGHDHGHHGGGAGDDTAAIEAMVKVIDRLRDAANRAAPPTPVTALRARRPILTGFIRTVLEQEQLTHDPGN